MKKLFFFANLFSNSALSFQFQSTNHFINPMSKKWYVIYPNSTCLNRRYTLHSTRSKFSFSSNSNPSSGCKGHLWGLDKHFGVLGYNKKLGEGLPLEGKFHTQGSLKKGRLGNQGIKGRVSQPIGMILPHREGGVGYKLSQNFGLVRDLTLLEKESLQKLVNFCMTNGKKNKSTKTIVSILCKLSKKHDDVFAFLVKALDNVKPVLEVRKIRIAGSTQLVPSVISANRQYNLAIRWIVDAAKKRRSTKKNASLEDCLLNELIDAYQNTGVVCKKKDDLHKLAESNRGFAHYRWW